MGKYIKYFKTAEEFAEYYNFGYWEPGPDDSDATALVAFVSERGTVYYENSDMSEFEIVFDPQSTEIDASATTVTFDVKTGLYWLEVYHNGELIDEYPPGLDKHYDYSVDANETPLTVTEDFVGKWYKKVPGVGDKGDYITEFQQPVTHLPDPNADPVKLTIEAQSQSLEGAGSIRLGNASLTGATSMLMNDGGAWTDISSDVYISGKRLCIDVPSGGYWDFKFEFESENQRLGDYFIQSQLKSVSISTNYPELGAQTEYSLQVPLFMNSSVEEVNIGEGMQTVSTGAFMMANSLNYIRISGDTLPAVSGNFFGMPASGTLEVDSRDVDNFHSWENAIPSGWTVLPEPTIGKVTLAINIDTSDNPNPIVGGPDVEYELSGAMELYDPNGNMVSSDNFGLYVDKEDHTRLEVQNAVDGEYTLVLRRDSADLLLQSWLSGGEFRTFRYDEESFQQGSEHISLHNGALANCANLEQVELGTGFTSVCTDSFENCESLNSISVEEANEPTISGGLTFETLPDQSGTLVVPSGADYSNWSAALGQDWTIDDSL